MNKSLEVFAKLTCLTEHSFNIKVIDLLKTSFKGADKRELIKILQKFLNLNKNEFDFLQVTPIVSGIDTNLKIAFRTDKFIGTVPLRSPVNGKQIGDFVIVPRYIKDDESYGNYIEILNLLELNLSAEFYDSIPLKSKNNFKPPLYFEASKYIIFLYTLLKIHWLKFQNIEKNHGFPLDVNWKKYFQYESNPNRALIFPNKSNLLTPYHKEYFQLKYVYEIATSEIKSFKTPLYIKYQLSNYIQSLNLQLYNFSSLRCSHIKINSNDNKIVRDVKIQGNKLLDKNYTIGSAWRIDISEIFERYVQYIISEVKKELSGLIYLNYKFKKKSKKFYNWELSHLEPDIILKTNNVIIFIDAKYKSHLYNKETLSDLLKEDHRSDLHQILSYSSFSHNMDKIGILCYPSTEVFHHTVLYQNSINEVKNKVVILGIPFDKSKLFETKNYTLQLIRDLTFDLTP